MWLFLQTHKKPMPSSTASQEILWKYFKKVLKDQSTEKLFQLCPARHTSVNMQILKNDSSRGKRKGFPLYSLNLQLLSSESPSHVCSDPNTAHRSTPLQPAEWMYIDVKKQRFQKAAVNLARLSEWSSSTDQVLLQGTASHQWAKKKKKYKPPQSPATDLSSDQATAPPLNALQRRVLNSCKSHITNWC